MAVSRTRTAPWKEDTYAATPGQVTFILTDPLTDPVSASVHINGVEYNSITDFTISGTTLTWLNTDFALETGDTLTAQYR